MNHEFYSLATEPLIAVGKDGVKWTPETPGIELKLVPDAPRPAASRALRLVQMREIARQFQGFDLQPKEGTVDLEEERLLRVLPAPLYRQPEVPMPADVTAGAQGQDPIDGAVFGQFYDWDPEILLVLEARPTEDGLRWHYGVGYVDYKPLRLQHKEKDVRSKPEKNFGSVRAPYYCVIGVTTRPKDPA